MLCSTRRRMMRARPVTRRHTLCSCLDVVERRTCILDGAAAHGNTNCARTHVAKSATEPWPWRERRAPRDGPLAPALSSWQRERERERETAWGRQLRHVSIGSCRWWTRRQESLGESHRSAPQQRLPVESDMPRGHSGHLRPVLAPLLRRSDVASAGWHRRVEPRRAFGMTP